MELQALFNDDDDDDPEAQQRPPAGHHRHGPRRPRQDTLLDRIRSANVVAGEAGGITQHIGAYQVERDGHEITFIDTPGHAAFTKMRARGARGHRHRRADGGGRRRRHAPDGRGHQPRQGGRGADRRGGQQDRPENADPQRVLTQLSEQGLVPESWGGDTITVEMSALQNLGVDDLLEQLLVVAELEELTANPTGRAKGIVLEANLDVGRGPVATILVDKGTLKIGDPIVAGAAWGTVRAMLDDQGNQIKEAGPSTPVQVLGLSVVPNAGDEFRAAPDEKTARPWPRPASSGAPGQEPAGRRPGPEGRQARGHLRPRSRRARSPRSTWCSRPTCRARSRPSPRACASWSATTCGWSSCTAPSAASPRTTSRWPPRPTPRSSASTSARTARPGSWPTPRTSRSGPTRSSTRSSRTSSGPWSACSPRSSKRWSRARPRSGRSSGSPGSAPSPAATSARASSPAGRKVRFLRDGVIIWKGTHHVAQALQGRRPRGAGGLRVRHRPVRLPGPQAGRPHRDLRGAGDRPDLTSFRSRLAPRCIG